MVKKGEKEEMETMTMIIKLHIDMGVLTHIMAEIRQTRGIYLQHMLHSILCFCHHVVTASHETCWHRGGQSDVHIDRQSIASQTCRCKHS